MLHQKKLLRIGIETDQGTAVTSDIEALVFDATMNPGSVFQTRQPNHTHLGHAKGIIEPRTGKATFRLELRSNGTTGLDPACAALLQGSGWQLNTLTYTPESIVASQKALTLTLWEDGMKKILYGAMGKAKLTGASGRRAFLECDFDGIWTAPISEAMPTPTHATIAPLICQAGTFSLQAYTAFISRFALDLQPSVVERGDLAAATGVRSFIITNRDPILTCDPEAVLLAAHDFYGMWLAGTTGITTIILKDATTTITIVAPECQYRELPMAERSGLAVHDLTAQLNYSTAGDDEVSIVTAANV